MTASTKNRSSHRATTTMVNSSYTMADAVFTACFLNTCLRNCDIVGMACFSPVVNTRGAIFTYKDGIVLRPSYLVFALYANLLKDTVLKTWNEAVPTMTGIDKLNKENTIDTVDITVTKDENGYAVATVNKDPKESQTVSLRILDDTCSKMRIHTVNGPSGDSYNDIGRTEVALLPSPTGCRTPAVSRLTHTLLTSLKYADLTKNTALIF